MSGKLNKYTCTLIVILILISSEVFAQDNYLVNEIFSPPKPDDNWQVADVGISKLKQAELAET